MTALLVDTSVLIKWFHSKGETQVAEARAIRDAHQRGDLDALVIDLAVYEMGNVLLRALHWSAAEVADQLDDLVAICGTPLVMAPEWRRDAALIGTTHQLTFYDAAWASSARAMGIPLVSADAQQLKAGLAESPAAVVERLRLPCQ
ncbi:MAG: type II toxin-antitoxin system VapC family toxin [Candidatus Dormibacteria bacterium]